MDIYMDGVSEWEVEKNQQMKSLDKEIEEQAEWRKIHQNPELVARADKAFDNRLADICKQKGYKITTGEISTTDTVHKDSSYYLTSDTTKTNENSNENLSVLDKREHNQYENMINASHYLLRECQNLVDTIEAKKTNYLDIEEMINRVETYLKRIDTDAAGLYEINYLKGLLNG